MDGKFYSRGSHNREGTSSMHVERARLKMASALYSNVTIVLVPRVLVHTSLDAL